MEPPSPNQNNLDQITIVEDDQQLYDWGIEHRLDQYYATEQQQQQQHQHQQQQQQHQQHQQLHQQHQQQQQQQQQYQYGNNDTLVEQQQHENYGTSADIKPKLPVNPIPPGQLVVKNRSKPVYKPPTIRPNGLPGRRPMLPQVDMDVNEMLKVERKRARNRVAATKCRMRKLERIAVLDDQASHLRSDNDQLAKLADKLRTQVYSLKQELRWHVNNGCKIHQQEDNQDLTTVDKATETAHFRPMPTVLHNHTGTTQLVNPTNNSGSVTIPSPRRTQINSEVLASPDSTTTNISSNIKTEPIERTSI
jgi:hypothetical protein